MNAKTDSGGYATYGEFVKDELDAQDRRKASFEQRGLAVITTAGTLATVLFALAALSTKASATFTLPQGARPWLLAALVLFFASSLCALVTNLPLSYQAVTPDEVRARLRETSPRTEEGAARDIAFTRLKALESAKNKNTAKGWALVIALGLEAAAVGCVAAAISIVL